MNREIKFRGKSALGGRWTYGFLTKKKTRRNNEINYAIAIDDCSMANTIPVHEPTIGQFTGLYDGDEGDDKESRNAIYENDICKVTETFTNNCGEERTEEYIMLVRYKDFKFEFYSYRTNPRDLKYIDDFCTVKVIGNRFDNPELMKEVYPY